MHANSTLFLSPRTKYYYHGKLLDWDERSSAGRYVRENCKPIHRYMVAPDNEEHRQLFDLISRLLDYDPSTRMTLAEALDHGFFRKLSPELRLHELESKQKRSESKENRERRRSSGSCSDRSSASSVSSHSTRASATNTSDHHQQHHSQPSSDRKRNSGTSQRNELNHNSSYGLSSFY